MVYHESRNPITFLTNSKGPHFPARTPLLRGDKLAAESQSAFRVVKGRYSGPLRVMTTSPSVIPKHDSSTDALTDGRALAVNHVSVP